MGWFGKKKGGESGDDQNIPSAGGAGEVPYDLAETMPGDELPMEISCEDLSEKLSADPAPSLLLIDVRETWEYESHRLQDTLHVPLGTVPDRADELAAKARDYDLVVTICEHGMRSYDAASFLRQRGAANTRSMNGGMALWAMAVGERMASGPVGGEGEPTE